MCRLGWIALYAFLFGFAAYLVASLEANCRAAGGHLVDRGACVKELGHEA